MAIPPWCCRTGATPFRASRLLNMPSESRFLHRTSTLFQGLLAVNNTSRFSHTIALSKHMRHLGYHESAKDNQLPSINHHHGIDTHKFTYIRRHNDESFAKMHTDIRHQTEDKVRHKATLRKTEQHNTLMQNHSRNYGKLAQIVTMAIAGTHEHNNQSITDTTTTIQSGHNRGATTRAQTAWVKETTFHTTLVTKIYSSNKLSQNKALSNERIQRLQQALDDEAGSKTEQTALASAEMQAIATAAMARLHHLREKNQQNTPLFNHKPAPVNHQQVTEQRPHNNPAVFPYNTAIRHDTMPRQTVSATDKAINAIARDRQMDKQRHFHHERHPDKD